MDRTSLRYQATRPADTELRERLKALAQERRRFGYRRLHVLLRREGHAVNRKGVQRLYREEKLTVRRRGGRKRAMGTRRPIEVPLQADRRWSLDFVSDQMTDGRRFRILTVVDNCTRECLALVADTSLSGLRVARELDAIVRRRGRPETIVSDNVLYSEALGGSVRTSLSGSMAVGGLVVNTSKRLPLFKDELSAITNTGYVDAGVAALTILNTRYLSRRKTRALSTGSLTRPHGTAERGSSTWPRRLRRRGGTLSRL